MERGSPWGHWRNAEIYDRFIRERPIYRRLNRRLVELAELAGARRVLDLACGTGATAEACLGELDARASVVAIDASEPMVQIARSHVQDPRVRFQVVAAGRVDEVLDGPFDRALCNAAFWQFPSMRAVLRGLSSILERGALFVFNVPAERVEGEPGTVHPFQAALARELETRAGRPFPRTPAHLDPERLEAWAEENGLSLVGRHRLEYRCPQGELIELMEIPAMLAPLAPELSPEERRGALHRARYQTDPEQPVLVPWVYFSLRRK